MNKRFEEYAYEQEGIEYWLARELQELLGYADWRNFLNAINKAKESCETTGEAVSDHFVDVNKMVKIGSGAERKQEDFMLTRYACYLIAQNGDPKSSWYITFDVSPPITELDKSASLLILLEIQTIKTRSTAAKNW